MPSRTSRASTAPRERWCSRAKAPNVAPWSNAWVSAASSSAVQGAPALPPAGAARRVVAPPGGLKRCSENDSRMWKELSQPRTQGSYLQGKNTAHVRNVLFECGASWSPGVDIEALSKEGSEALHGDTVDAIIACLWNRTRTQSPRLRIEIFFGSKHPKRFRRFAVPSENNTHECSPICDRTSPIDLACHSNP